MNGQPQLSAQAALADPEEVKCYVAGLCRDLRGIVSAITKRDYYQRLLLDGWFCLPEEGDGGGAQGAFGQAQQTAPTSPIFTCLQLAGVMWAHDPEVGTNRPLLRLDWPLLRSDWPLLRSDWPLLRSDWPLLSLVWPLLRLDWPLLRLVWSRLA